MKRTALHRKTPLRRGTSQLRRSPMKPWRRKPEDKMTPDVHAAIIERDRVCFVFEYVDRTHRCADRYGEHGPSDRQRLTVEHVKVSLRSGKRAPSRVETGVALCARANDEVPSRAIRGLMRARLTKLYPAFWAEARGDGHVEEGP